MFKSYTQLQFVEEKAKVNASYYVTKLLPNLIKDCRHLLSDNFIFHQDGAPAHTHTAALAHDWIKKKCPGLLEKKTNGHRIRQISVHWSIMTADIHDSSLKHLKC